MTVELTLPGQGAYIPEAVGGSLCATRSPIRVLLIEDNDEHAEWVSLLLADEPLEPSGCFELERAVSLAEGMDRLSLPDIDVILLDLGMPELAGYRSYTAIRAAAAGVPVVVLTGDESLFSVAMVVGSGAQAYLLKNGISSARLRDALVKAYRPGTTERIS